jgi:hypothetical protein
MAHAVLAPATRRDWIFANPWPWMAAGLLACCWAWGWAHLFGTRASDNRVVLLAVGLLAAGVAVALRLNTARGAYLERLPAVWQRSCSLGLAALFALLLLALSALVGAGLMGTPGAPLHPGLAIVFWCLLAPLSAAAMGRCLRLVRWGERVSGAEEAAILLWLATLCLYVGARALDLGAPFAEDWDSIRFFLRSATLATLFGAALVAVTPAVRRLGISLLILFHFGGICIAALAASPSPWLVTQIWMRVYRPYLEFMYLNNAYHFYAPEPGPASFVWFRLIYADPEGQEVGVWEKVPRVDSRGRPDHSVALEYQRFLAMTEGTVPTDPPPTTFTINKDGQPDFAPFFKRRLAAAPNSGIVLGQVRHPLQVPFDPLVVQGQQFMAPNRAAKFLLESFARHAATLPHPDDADRTQDPRYTIKRVKIYRVIHAIPSFGLVAGGIDPVRDPTHFRPIFMGEYSPEGVLLEPDDPFLYWLLPIMRVQRGQEVEIRNYAAHHAGDPRWVRRGKSEEWIDPEQAP